MGESATLRRGRLGYAGAASRNAMVSLPRFLIAPEALAGPSTTLTGAELHHLRVRRLIVGSPLILANGLGQQRHGVVVAMDRQRAVIELSDDAPKERESSLRLVLAQALLKANKLDLVIAKATELGVSEIVFFDCQRSIRHVGSDRLQRWRRIAQGASKQSQRSTVPTLSGPVSFAELLDRDSQALRLFLWEERSGTGWDVGEVGY